jgi:hypothetical protein
MKKSTKNDPKKRPAPIKKMNPISLDESLRKEAASRESMSSSKPGFSKEYKRESHKPYGGGIKSSKARESYTTKKTYHVGGGHTTTNVEITDKIPMKIKGKKSVPATAAKKTTKKKTVLKKSKK